MPAGYPQWAASSTKSGRAKVARPLESSPIGPPSGGRGRTDVLVEPEQVGGVVAILQGHQPLVLLLAVRLLQAIVALAHEVGVRAARGVGLERRIGASGPVHGLVEAGRVRGPAEHVQHK